MWLAKANLGGKIMKADYKNWIPKGMLYSLVGGTLVSLVLCVLLTFFGFGLSSNVRNVLVVIFAVAFLVCAGFSKWCIDAYTSFSYDGSRKLSKQIVEGTAKFIFLPDGGVGLDVGCGSGALTIACAKRNTNAKIIGIDRWGKEYPAYSKELCEKNAEAEGLTNVTFQEGNAIKLDFPDETFDAVASNYVYHNISGHDKQALVLETLRVLKKGGVFAIHDLMGKGRYGDMDEFVKKLKSMGYESVELIDTTDKIFMTPSEARRLGLLDSMLLVGVK